MCEAAIGDSGPLQVKRRQTADLRKLLALLTGPTRLEAGVYDELPASLRTSALAIISLRIGRSRRLDFATIPMDLALRQGGGELPDAGLGDAGSFKVEIEHLIHPFEVNQPGIGGRRIVDPKLTHARAICEMGQPRIGDGGIAEVHFAQALC